MKRILIALPLLALVAMATNTGTRHHRTVPLPPAPPARAGSLSPNARHHEDLVARRGYRQLRLADPATGRIPPDIRRLEQEFAARLPRRPASDKAVNWSFRGPDNVGGRTRTLAVDVDSPGLSTLLAGGISGGLWRSEDDGQSWALTNGSSQGHHVSTLVQDTRPGHRQEWYYGTGEGEGGSAAWPSNEAYAFPGDGIFKSTDGGRSWSVLPATAGADPQFFTSPWQVVWRLAVDPSNAVSDEVYAATWGGIYRSLDGGGSWARVLGHPTAPASYADLVVSPTGVVYATLSFDGGQHGAFRSTDGVNWTDITPPGYSGYDRIVMAMAPSNENIVWFQVANTYGQADAALFRYQFLSGTGAGAGGWWQDRSSLLVSLPGTYGNTFFETQDSYCQMVTVHPTDPETVYLGGVYLYRSTDGFLSAEAVTLIGGWDYPGHHADLHWLVFRPGSDSVAYTGSDGGVHRTSAVGAPAVAWTALNQGYRTSQFYTVAIDENLDQSPVAIGGTQDNGTLHGAQGLAQDAWAYVLAGDGGYCAVGDASGTVGTYYMSYQQNYGVFRLQLDNATGALQASTRIDPPAADTSLWLKPYILDPNDRNLMYLAAENRVWRNSGLADIPDGNTEPTGINWEILTEANAGQVVSALAVSRSPARILYFGTAGGQVCRLAGAAGAPAGSSPVRLDVGAGFPPGGYVSSLAVHPDDDQQVLLAFSNYNVVNLFHTANGGASWTAVEGNLGGANSPSVRSVVWAPSPSTDYCFAATSTGLYVTAALDGPATVWQQEASALVGTAVVDMLAYRATDRVLVAGTHGKGVVRGFVDPSAVADRDLPGRVRLAPNVPNPFNPATTLRFTIPRDGLVTVDIHDLAGRRVRRLVEEYRSAGEHAVVWRGTDEQGRPAPSGTYLCRVHSAGQEDSRSLVLVR